MDRIFIQELHDVNPIVDVASEYVALKRAGKNFVCCCPFHSEKSPSCTFFTDTQSFFCFGCGAGGDVISFVMQAENLDFMEAVSKLASRAGLHIPEKNETSGTAVLKDRIREINRETANFYFLNLIKGPDKRGLAYLIKRGMKPETIKKYALGFAPDNWDSLYKHLKHLGFKDNELLAADVCKKSKNGSLYDAFRNRVMFPIVDFKGCVIGFGGRVLDDSKPKYLNTSDTKIFDKGSYCFSLNFAKNSPSKILILCEGYMDVISLNQAGFENAIATLGTAITSAQARLIEKYADKVVISYDSDEAGQKACHKAITLLEEVGLKTSVLHMNGAKDPDEYIKKFGPEAFRKLIYDAGDALSFEIDRCALGLDIESSEVDKANFIKRVIAVLADIENPVLQEVYISKVSVKYNFDKAVLKNQIKGLESKNKKNFQKQEFRKIEANIGRKLITDSNGLRKVVKNSKEIKAEKKILGMLLCGTADLKKISTQITAEMFTDSLHRKIYEFLLSDSISDDTSAFYALPEILNSAEMGIASELYSTAEKNPSDEDINAYVTCIVDGNRKINRKEELSDEDLLKLANAKKN